VTDILCCLCSCAVGRGKPTCGTLVLLLDCQLVHHWAVDREVLSRQAILVRAQFEANRGVSNLAEAETLVEKGEAKLASLEHPDPYRNPYLPGSTLYQRNTPVPHELLHNPYAAH
jgi:hypothetical protein